MDAKEEEGRPRGKEGGRGGGREGGREREGGEAISAYTTIITFLTGQTRNISVSDKVSEVALIQSLLCPGMTI